MTIALNEKWIWDSWYTHDGKQWHGYFLQADKSLGNPDLRHWNVTHGHAVSQDLTNWNHLGTSFAPSSGPAWDDYTVWTGSVVRGDDSYWHFFYTGTSHAENGLYQRIGHAISTDLHHWTRVGDGLCLDYTGPYASHYETRHQSDYWHDRAMRDPWVMRNPHGSGWLMYFTARASGIDEPNAAGAIGLATSDDLNQWTLQPPVFIGAFGQLEVPQVFQMHGSWYCLFCTAAEHWAHSTAAKLPGSPVTGNHYLVGDTAIGPWRLTDAPFLDGAQPGYRYAARVVESGAKHLILGFLDGGVDNFGGVVLNPQPLLCSVAGVLSIEKTL